MLELIPSLMLIVLLIFLGLIVYLSKVLYQPLINFMDQRDNTIAKDRVESETLTGDAKSLQDEAEAILSGAKQEAIALKQSALEEATSEAASKISSKEAELDKAYSEFLDKLEKEREELQNGLLSQIPLIKEALKAKFTQLQKEKL